MIRKAGHIIVILLFVVLTTGVTVTSHFCGGRFVGASLFSSSGEGCSGYSSCTSDCCHDETRLFLIEEDFMSPGFSAHTPMLHCMVTPQFTSPTPACLDGLFAVIMPKNGSPPPTALPTFLAYIQVYRL